MSKNFYKNINEKIENSIKSIFKINEIDIEITSDNFYSELNIYNLKKIY